MTLPCGYAIIVWLVGEGPMFMQCAERKWNLMRVKITLSCTECKQRNYNTMKNKKNDPDRLEMNKYCSFCRKHTPHKEGK